MRFASIFLSLTCISLSLVAKLRNTDQQSKYGFKSDLDARSSTDVCRGTCGSVDLCKPSHNNLVNHAADLLYLCPNHQPSSSITLAWLRSRTDEPFACLQRAMQTVAVNEKKDFEAAKRIHSLMQKLSQLGRLRSESPFCVPLEYPSPMGSGIFLHSNCIVHMRRIHALAQVIHYETCGAV